MGLFDFFKKTVTKDITPPAPSNIGSKSVLSIEDESLQSKNEDIVQQQPIDEQKSSALKPSPMIDYPIIELEKWYEKKLDSFKSDLIKLVNCTSSDKQFTIGYMEQKELLSIKKVQEKNGYSFKVFNNFGEELGKIPTKFEEYFQQNKVIIALFHETILGTSGYYPVIKVFWDIPKCDDSPTFRIKASKSRPTLHNKKPYVILDLETTGLNISPRARAKIMLSFCRARQPKASFIPPLSTLFRKNIRSSFLFFQDLEKAMSRRRPSVLRTTRDL